MEAKGFLGGKINGFNFLDDAHRMLLNGQVNEGMDLLLDSLWALRLLTDLKEWGFFVTNKILKHPIATLIYQDPFTLRAYQKPRGYAGDAIMIDYIYGLSGVNIEKLPSPAKEIHAYTTNQAIAIKYRAMIIAKMIDQEAATRPNLRLLSVAAGHLREVYFSEAIKTGAVKEIVAFERDKDSLEKMKIDYAGLPVSPFSGNIRNLIVGRVSDWGMYDFIYSGGLFDYLEETVGQRLISSAFSMLNPWGKLVIANLTPGNRELGYAESFMDWKLVYRDRSDMVRLAAFVPLSQVASISTFQDPTDHVLFLTIEKNANEVIDAGGF